MNAKKFMKGDYIEHPRADWGLGKVLEDCYGANLMVVFAKVGVKNLSLSHVQPIVVDPATVLVSHEKELAVKHRIYFNEPFADIFEDLKSKLPGFIVIIENGVYYEVLYEDAELFRAMYGWTVYERSPGQPLTGFPLQMQKVWQDLKDRNLPYVVVGQLSPSNANDKISRQVGEIYWQKK